MLYMLATGEYSDYSIHVTLDGPLDLDIKAAYDAALASANHRATKMNKIPWSERPKDDIYGGDTSDYLMSEMIKEMERRGCKECDVTEIHLGNYHRAHLEVSGARAE